MEDALKKWREFLRSWFERQEERKIREEKLSGFYLEQERLFKFLAKASRKRAYSGLEEEISVSMDEFNLIYQIGKGILIAPNTPTNDNCYLQRVEVQGYIFRTITAFLVPYPPEVYTQEYISS
ncbi:hypothetical protein J4429_04740 [Candidatus Pacearchaeota archaeon]|nr:hypothetical protein [Candidatus Pacearchaeota archaeon]